MATKLWGPLVLLLASCASCASQPPPPPAAAPEPPPEEDHWTGRWMGELVRPDGGRRRYELVLKADGEKLTGSVFSPSGESPIAQGAIGADEITFTARGGVYKGTLAADRLQLTIPG